MQTMSKHTEARTLRTRAATAQRTEEFVFALRVLFSEYNQLKISNTHIIANIFQSVRHANLRTLGRRL